MYCDLFSQIHELAFWVAVVVLTSFLVVGLTALLCMAWERIRAARLRSGAE